MTAEQKKLIIRIGLSAVLVVITGIASYFGITLTSCQSVRVDGEATISQCVDTSVNTDKE